MWTVFWAVVAGYCAMKWLSYRVGYMAILLWIEGKEYTPPSSSEMDACIREVVRRTFGLK